MLLSPEAQLLLLTAGTPPRAPTLRPARADLDWSKLCDLAHREAAASIVTPKLRRIGVRAPPGEAESRLQKLAMVSEFRMRQLEGVLHDTLDSFAQRGIPVMLLKGSGLAYTVYASFADRPMTDLDVLVRPARATEAWSLLQSQGWTWPSHEWPRDRYTTHQHLPPLLKPSGGGTRLEIHADLLPGGHPFRLATDAVWERARPLFVNGRRCLAPHPLHQLWHVCVHFAWLHEMQWGAWRAFRDVAAIVRRGAIDWGEFVALASETRAATCCFWTLRMTRDLVGAEIPEDALGALRPPYAEFFLERLERHYVGQLLPSERSCPSVGLSRRLWEVGVAPRGSDHGTARPWHVSEPWISAAARVAPRPHLLRRVRNQLEKLPAWFEYFRRITASRVESRLA